MMAAGKDNPLALLAGNAGVSLFIVAAVCFGISLIAAVLLYPLFQAIMMRWWISGLRFGTLAVIRGFPRAGLSGLSALCSLHRAVHARCDGRRRGQRLRRQRAGRIEPRFHARRTVCQRGHTRDLCHDRAWRVDHLSGRVTFAMWRLGVQTAELSGADALETVRASGLPEFGARRRAGRRARRRRHLMARALSKNDD